MKLKLNRWTAAALLSLAFTPALSFARPPVGGGGHAHPSVIRDHSSRPHSHESVAHH